MYVSTVKLQTATFNLVPWAYPIFHDLFICGEGLELRLQLFTVSRIFRWFVNFVSTHTLIQWMHINVMLLGCNIIAAIQHEKNIDLFICGEGLELRLQLFTVS